MGNIKVLWMNNGEERLQKYVEAAHQYGIDITTCKDPNSYRKVRNCNAHEYDVILLNSDYLYKYSHTLKNDIEDKLVIILAKDDIQKTEVSFLSNYLSAETFLLNEYEIWLPALMDKVNEFPLYRIRQRYEVVCKYYNDHDFFELLKEFERGDYKFLIDTSICNRCRQVLEWIKNDPNLSLNNFSKEVDKREDVPEYVKRSFHRCCSVGNDGSHYLETVKQIKENRAPYLNASLVYDLLNILYWWANQNEDNE